MGIRMITAGQIKMIHSLASRLAIDDAAYRAALQSRFGVTTSKAMTMDQAGRLIDEWELDAIEQRVWRYQSHRARYADLFSYSKTKEPSFTHGGRNPGMASWQQIQKINDLWLSLTGMQDDDDREKALRKFVQKIAKVSDLRFLDMNGAQGVIAALMKMRKFYRHDQEENRAAQN